MRESTVLGEVSAYRRRVARLLLGGIAVVAGLHVVAVGLTALRRLSDSSLAATVVSWLNLDSEAGFGTWFAIVQLALAATIAALIAAHQRAEHRPWRGWAGLSVLLAAMSVDEQVRLHENLGRLGAAWGLTILGHDVWFVPALVVVAIIVVALLPFVLRLPRRTRRLVMGAGALYVLGAVGFEVIAWSWVLVTGDGSTDAPSLMIGMLQWGEETLELLAVAVVVMALLDYAASVTSDAGARGDDRVDDGE